MVRSKQTPEGTRQPHHLPRTASLKTHAGRRSAATGPNRLELHFCTTGVRVVERIRTGACRISPRRYNRPARRAPGIPHTPTAVPFPMADPPDDASRRNGTSNAPAEAPEPDGGGGRRRKVRTKQCFHCFTPCTVIHRVRVVQDGPWESVCDVCWATRCDGNPHYAYGGLWSTGRLTQVGERKARAPKPPRKAPRKRSRSGGSAGGKATPAGSGRPAG